MRHLSSQIWNIESRIRKEVTNDLHQRLQLQVELNNRAAKRTKVDDSGETFYKRNLLTSDMLHLNGDHYVCSVIVFFLSHRRVHIRRYATDQEGFLHSSKNGVSLSPSVLHSFNFSDQFLIIDEDLCTLRKIKE